MTLTYNWSMQEIDHSINVDTNQVTVNSIKWLCIGFDGSGKGSNRIVSVDVNKTISADDFNATVMDPWLDEAIDKASVEAEIAADYAALESN